MNYHRSYSQSQTNDVEEPDYASPANSRTNHKSLPDLHTQFNRNSPYSEYSEGRGNRSNKSNSSLNRDSGGSSGHYTHRSEPNSKQDDQYNCHTQSKPYSNNYQKYVGPENRRDSGSSTQHSSNSYYDYNGVASRFDCIECDIQSQSDANGLLNFTTSVVPEAFQDHFTDNDNDNSNQKYRNEPNSRLTFYRKNSFDSNLQDPLPIESIEIGEGEVSPPLGTFKRQKCLRLKQYSRHPSPGGERNTTNEDRKKILRSKSDLSHRYFSRNLQRNDINYVDNGGASMERTKSENLTELERFFDRLGLTDDLYNKYIAKNSSDSNRSSPVFFSDVPTVDSDQLPDSTETQLEMQPYRPIEPTSIVERNARIIKWLVACRKALPNVEKL